jgi:ATP-dependent helicase HrpB
MLLVAIEAEEQRRAGESAIGVIRSASAIEPEWLLDLFPDRLRDEQRVRFVADAERVDVDSLLFYDDLVLEESRGAAAGSDAVSAALAEAALERGPSAYLPRDTPDTEPARTLARLRFARDALPELELPALGTDEVARTVRSLAAGKRRFDDLREGNVLDFLLSALDHKQRQAFETAAPDSIALPSGRRVRVEYEDGKPPWIESRLQDFFGWTDGPRLAKGRVPVTLHLLAPNKRAVQVTGDLKGFWERHYPAVRKELMRRYPRHAWPDNPRVVPPPKPPRAR